MQGKGFEPSMKITFTDSQNNRNRKNKNELIAFSIPDKTIRIKVALYHPKSPSLLVVSPTPSKRSPPELYIYDATL